MKDKIAITNKLLNSLTEYKGIPSNDIPDIALYMDQVTTFMDKKLGCFKRRDDDKILTKTMINNYTKAKLSFPPINKKYEKEHIMMFTLIYHMKQIISVNDMAKLLNPIISYVDKNDDKINNAEELYSIFTDMEASQLDLFEKNVQMIIEDLSADSKNTNISDDAFSILLILTLIIQAERRKNLAEKLIDAFFEDAAVEKKSEKK